MNKKTIRMFCFGPVAADPKADSPWEDVWLQYVMRRRIVKEGPCFVGMAGLDSDIWIEERAIADSEKMSRRKGCADWREHHEERLNELLDIRRHLESNRFHCDNWESGLPNIYVAGKKYLNRKDIEMATAWYLREKGVLKSEARFRWNKPRFIATPVSFEPPGDDDGQER